MCTAPMDLTCMSGSAPSVKEVPPESGIGGLSKGENILGKGVGKAVKIVLWILLGLFLVAYVFRQLSWT